MVFWFGFILVAPDTEGVKSGNPFGGAGLGKCLEAAFVEEVKCNKHRVYLVLWFAWGRGK